MTHQWCTETLSLLLLAGSLGWPERVRAEGRYYAGGTFGVSTLSADGRSVVAPGSAAVSLYKPSDGWTVNVFGGVDVHEYLALQGSYGWSRNGLILTSSLVSVSRADYSEQSLGSSQHAVVGDLLLYFRPRESWARPYLSVGGGVVLLRSTESRLLVTAGQPVLPPAEFSSTAPALRVAVGIDLSISHGWAFRYSFSETIRSNAISTQLSPPGKRHLATFQNLFGVVKRF